MININALNQINLITVLIAVIFLLPILAGILHPFSRYRIQESLISLFNNLEIILGIVLAVYLTRVLFSEQGNSILTRLYQFVPALQDLLTRQDIRSYAMVMLALLLLIIFLLRLFTAPLYRFAIVPLAKRFSSAIHGMNRPTKGLIGGIWQLPRSLWLVFMFSLLLSFYINFGGTPAHVAYINDSAAYQSINDRVLHPLLNSRIAKQIPVLYNDSFKKQVTDLFPAGNENEPSDNPSDNPDSRKIRVIEYFNGMTLDAAVTSSPAIDNRALKIVGSETSDRMKAKLLYQWVSKNIAYDDHKAAIITANPSGIASGSIVAYTSRRGICFDYSCLYVSMCRAVGLKVRFVTGLGYSGTAWGDHAWNQVYYPAEERWINVDTTFGSAGYNYFDKDDFAADHQDDDIQGQW